MPDSCAIIIPAINFNKDVQKCIDECILQKNVNVRIFLVTNKKIKKKIKASKVKLVSFGDINMSKKRNMAVKKCKEKFIAFIDSDAYPEKDWLYNGIEILKKNKNIGMVTGPDIPFKKQLGFSHYIALAHKSFLLSGNKFFRKNLKKNLICKQASSCNMILERKIYKKIGGMNEKIYIGEDKELCDKLNKIKKIMYSPNVLIYHKIRDFVPFILQRFSYGTSILDIVKSNKKIELNNIQYFIPLCVVFLYIAFPFFIHASFIGNLIFFLILLLNSLILFESLRISLNPLKFSIIFIIIKLNILSFGLGSIAKIMGLKKSIKKIYTKR